MIIESQCIWTRLLSCSCMTQLTTVADDYGAGNNGHPLHGIYDNGISGGGIGLNSSAAYGGGLDRNEALTGMGCSLCVL